MYLTRRKTREFERAKVYIEKCVQVDWTLGQSEPSSLVVDTRERSKCLFFDSTRRARCSSCHPESLWFYKKKVVTWMTLARVFLAFSTASFMLHIQWESRLKHNKKKETRTFPTHNKLEFISALSRRYFTLFRHMFALVATQRSDLCTAIDFDYVSNGQIYTEDSSERANKSALWTGKPIKLSLCGVP